MSVFLVNRNGKKCYQVHFMMKGTRYTKTGFKTKAEAKKAEMLLREEVQNPKPVEKIQTDMDFLTLVNKRLDHIKVYQSEKHYKENTYYAKKWIKMWGKLLCSEITQDMIENFIIDRSSSGIYAANADLRLLRATFNFGIKRKFITNNPTHGIPFLPVEKGTRKYIPTQEEIDKVIEVADQDTQDYLIAIQETMARVNEVNRLQWNDVDLKDRLVILKTRKKRGGNLTPRSIPMTQKLFDVLTSMYATRNPSIPFVFWHKYWSRKENKFVKGAYIDRKLIMKTLCKKAGVKYFRFHALRHSGASILDNANVPIGDIQRILGHENRKTTEIYLHGIGNSERQAMNIFEGKRKILQTILQTNENTIQKEGTYH